MKQVALSSVSSSAGVFLTVLIAAFLSGCAGSSIEATRQYTGDTPLPRPPVMLIYDHTLEVEQVKVDTAGLDSEEKKATTAERLKVGRAVAQALSEQIVTELTERGITARRATATTPIPMHALVVKGQFVSIDEGDQMKRTIIGFGAGADELRTRSEVFQQTASGLRRLAEGKGEAHGRRTPGVLGPGAVAAGTGIMAGLVVSGGANVASEVKGSMATNVKNLAKQFADRVEKAYKREGWL